MFCPQCKVEYRAGFARCSDCDLDLVHELPKTAIELADPEPGDPNEDPFCSFWKGEDARVHAELCTVLDEAAIPHNTVFRRDHLFNMRNFPAYEIGVPFSLFERAENVVKAAYSTEEVADVGSGEFQLPLLENSAPSRQPETLTPSPDDHLPGPPTVGENADWFPEDATVKIWSGGKDQNGQFLVAALHENGIRCRLDNFDNHVQDQELYVLPEDENRAREIIREVIQGQPPE
jgi:hypothetical protein